MPAGFTKLTALLDRRKVIALALVVSAVAASWLLAGRLTSARRAVDELRVEIEAKESLAMNAPPPTVEETSAWQQQEAQVRSILVSDDAVPVVYEEISRLASQSQLERFAVDTQERTIEDGAALGASLQSVGVQRYLAITLRFRADYRNAAAFIGNVANLPRSIVIDSVDLRRDFPLVDATVVLHLYKRGAG